MTFVKVESEAGEEIFINLDQIFSITFPPPEEGEQGRARVILGTGQNVDLAPKVTADLMKHLLALGTRKDS
jgi:hypothetical protein